MEQKMNIAFFGTPNIAVRVLEELEQAGIVPQLVITNPDRPQGRKHTLTPPPVKVWAQQHNLPVFQPDHLKDKDSLTPLTQTQWDLFVVVAYGQIMPKWLIDLPKHGTLNVHPSLLPKLRGASPIRSAILEGFKETGVTIMLMDEKMDHGPVVAQTVVELPEPIPGHILDERLAKEGGALLADTIPKWIEGTIQAQEQKHDEATYSQKFTTDMAQLELNPYVLPTGEEALAMIRKIYAFEGNPGTFFIYNGKRVKITQATYDAGMLQIHKVIPEGKNEIAFETFLKQI